MSSLPDSVEATETPYPAAGRALNTNIAGIHTNITRTAFSDKILITASQAGRLNHWVHVPLANTNPATAFMTSPYTEDRPETALLPLAHLTATTVFGGTKPEMDVLGQTLATNVASAILTQRREEGRLLVLGLGLETSVLDRGCEDLVAALIEIL